MRIALYDFARLSALTTIEFPDTELVSPMPWKLEVTVNADIVLELKLISCLIFLPLEMKHNAQRTYVSMPAGPVTAALVRFAVYPGTELEQIPPQHRPAAVRAIREALKMGDAR